MLKSLTILNSPTISKCLTTLKHLLKLIFHMIQIFNNIKILCLLYDVQIFESDSATWWCYELVNFSVHFPLHFWGNRGRSINIEYWIITATTITRNLQQCTRISKIKLRGLFWIFYSDHNDTRLMLYAIEILIFSVYYFRFPIIKLSQVL